MSAIKRRVKGAENILAFLIAKCLQLFGMEIMPSTQDIASQITFRLYSGSFFNYVDIPISNVERIWSSETFDPNKTTAIYIHGYSEQPTDPTLQAVISAYLEKDYANIMLLNWTPLASGNYFVNVLPNVRHVGHLLASSIKTLVKYGLNISEIILVGHSLGSQIASETGKKLQEYGLKLDRIIGLDPAFPGLSTRFFNYLKKGDADFVYCLHTDAGLYGVPFSNCDADFWANSGRRPQKGCSIGLPFQQTPEELQEIITFPPIISHHMEKEEVVYDGKNI